MSRTNIVQIVNVAEGFRENVRLCSLLCCQLEGEVCYGDCEGFLFSFSFVVPSELRNLGKRLGNVGKLGRGKEKRLGLPGATAGQRQREEAGAKRQGGGGADSVGIKGRMVHLKCM